MKIKLKNLGPIKEAAFTVGDLTVICGANNTGKTYATYALFGFLDQWRSRLNVSITEDMIENLFNDGIIQIDLKVYLQKSETILKEGCKEYSKNLPTVFNSSRRNFITSEFECFIDKKYHSNSLEYKREIQTANTKVLSFMKEEGESELLVSYLLDNNNLKIPQHLIKKLIEESIIEATFSPIIPNAFIVSAERTGAAIFRQELNFSRHRLVKESHNKIQDSFKGYPLPVERNIQFNQKLENISKVDSFIAKKHADILNDFDDIVGGKYLVTKDDALYFQPQHKQVKLTMDESSSAVRSLLDIGFYLRHIAQVGEILMIDEPELNLHPENQRRIARLFSRLVNIGIKVFITTHSDYIIKEFNTLIMLNQDKTHLQAIQKEEGYSNSELLKAHKVKVYMTEKIQADSHYQTLTAAKITQTLGIEIDSFDATINKMNQIQEAIIWGD